MSSHETWQASGGEDDLTPAPVGESAVDDNFRDLSELLTDRFSSLRLVRTQGDVSFYVGRHNESETRDRLIGLRILAGHAAEDPTRLELFKTEAFSAASASSSFLRFQRF